MVIESAGRGPVDDGGTYDWRDFKRLLAGKRPKRPNEAQSPDPPIGVDAAFLEEVHHRQYGRPWALGKYVFEYLLDRGLRPDQRLLDFGCGALRFGTYAIDYLDVGRYFGVDAHRKSLEAAARYEIPLHRLAHKRPRLLWDAAYGVDYFQSSFDWIVDVSTSIHVPEDDLVTVFSRLSNVLAPGGRLVVCPDLRLDEASRSALGLRLAHEELQECRMLQGHSFDSTNHWFELVRDA